MGKRLNPYSVKSRHWLALTFAALSDGQSVLLADYPVPE